MTECKMYFGDQIFYDDVNSKLQKEDIPFWKLFLKPEMEVLEVACGTGRIAIPLSKKVKKYIGIDYSEDMLTIARQKADKIDNLEFRKGDMTKLNREVGEFDRILCGYNSFQHLLSDEKAIAFLEGCQSLLKKEGLLFIDVFNPDERFLNKEITKEEKISFYSQTLKCKMKLKEERIYDEKTRINHITSIYEKIDTGEEWRANTQMRQYYPGQIEQLAERTGWKLVKKLGNYNSTIFQRESPKQIYFFAKT